VVFFVTLGEYQKNKGLAKATMENAMKISELLMIFLYVTGTIGISYVESKIMSRSGDREHRGFSLPEVYWHSLSGKERLFFWGGVIFLGSSCFSVGHFISL
jgi:hypothetical protein